jgi:hypothetical protein
MGLIRSVRIALIARNKPMIILQASLIATSTIRRFTVEEYERVDEAGVFHPVDDLLG